VNKPASPTAVLRGYLASPGLLRVMTINSTPNPKLFPSSD
jgi:hypothetical protein